MPIPVKMPFLEKAGIGGTADEESVIFFTIPHIKVEYPLAKMEKIGYNVRWRNGQHVPTRQAKTTISNLFMRDLPAYD